ncbi:hypothetical protein K438DRAFT_1086544 [Mycena galopus ATCC 62051]|nr:hypothetical protein K438DRAFT_1086544 [Mycena galopus ATCC 62051]
MVGFSRRRTLCSHSHPHVFHRHIACSLTTFTIVLSCLGLCPFSHFLSLFVNRNRHLCSSSAALPGLCGQSCSLLPRCTSSSSQFMAYLTFFAGTSLNCVSTECAEVVVMSIGCRLCSGCVCQIASVSGERALMVDGQAIARDISMCAASEFLFFLGGSIEERDVAGDRACNGISMKTPVFIHFHVYQYGKGEALDLRAYTSPWRW